MDMVLPLLGTVLHLLLGTMLRQVDIMLRKDHLLLQLDLILTTTMAIILILFQRQPSTATTTTSWAIHFQAVVATKEAFQATTPLPLSLATLLAIIIILAIVDLTQLPQSVLIPQATIITTLAIALVGTV
jgi:hypothetical protein